MYLYKYNHESNAPFQFSPQRLCGNSCNWAHNVPRIGLEL